MKHVFENLLDPLVIVYGEPKTTDVVKFLNEYAAILSDYDEDELIAAKTHIMRTQKGKFFPTPGECLQACEAAQKLHGPAWPERMLVRIKEAGDRDTLKALHKRIDGRRRSFLPETIDRLRGAVDRRCAELGEDGIVVDITARMLGEGGAA